MTERPSRVRVMLSLQRALLGEVFPALRAITVEWGPALVKYKAYVDGPIAEQDAESVSVVSAEVTADFGEDVEVQYEVVRVDAPARITDGTLWVFARREE